MLRWTGNRLFVALRSVLFQCLSALVSVCFLIFLPLMWAPNWLGWPVLRIYIWIQLFLLWLICGQSYRLEGSEKVPSGPAILASRHEALWETLVLPMLFNNPVVFLKEEILRYPVAGTIARKLGHIGLDRSGNLEQIRQAFDMARDQALEGRHFLIFPSGTRAPEHRGRVQKGVAIVYRALNLPVVPVVLNSGALWPHKSWLRFPGVITVRVLDPIPAGQKTSAFIQKLEQDLGTPA